MGLYREFFEGLLANPRGVSALTPSSNTLAAAIAATVNPHARGLVVELGAGTGAITAALLARGVAPQRVVALENSPRFCRLLQFRFPKLRVIHGDALEFDAYLEPEEQVSAIVSGLPLLHFAPALRRRLIEKALDRQGPQARFVQLSYGWTPAIPAGGDFAITRQVVWRNFPPAHIWTYRRAAQYAPVRLAQKLAPELSTPS